MKIQFSIWSFLLFGLCCSTFGRNIFVSPNGESSNRGLTVATPLNSIATAIEVSNPGDTIFLLPGLYPGGILIEGKVGIPDHPVVLKSFAEDPRSFAIIDATSNPQDPNGLGFIIKNSSWINIEHIIFKNCWPSVIDIYDTEYISIKSCHFHTGKRVIHPQGHGSHHILVENCFIRQPDEVWDTWSWVELHHGEYGHYNGGLLHPKESGGGHVMRGNTIINLFNGFRTRPIQISEDGNIEVYNNILINIRDNDFEPEGWAWNIHYYYNQHYNIHKVYSIDNVKGGQIYIYGNTYTQSKDDWALKEVSGIFKYKTGPITYPCYAFNNSYYTAAKVLRRPESTNHLLKHFNNAYHFFEGSERFQLINWQPGYEFDYDCINHNWPENIINHQQESHGLQNTEAGFIHGALSDFRLAETSPCIDAAKTMTFEEFDWVQQFKGKAPDIGAYEGNDRIDGPPFRFIPSPEGAHYQERPRITRHYVKDHMLKLFFSAPLDTLDSAINSLEVFEQMESVKINNIKFEKEGYSLFVSTDQKLSVGAISIYFKTKPMGLTGLPLTYWGSTISIGKKIEPIPDLSLLEKVSTEKYIDDLLEKPQILILCGPSNPVNIVQLVLPAKQKFDNQKLSIYDLQGIIAAEVSASDYEADFVNFDLNNIELHTGIYVVAIPIEGVDYSNILMVPSVLK